MEDALMHWLAYILCDVAVVWAWDYASPAKRKARAHKRREAGERILRRILG